MDDEEIYINGKPEPEFDDFKSAEYYNSAINRMMKYFDQLHDHGYIGNRVYEIKKTNLFIYALGLYHHSLITYEMLVDYCLANIPELLEAPLNGITCNDYVFIILRIFGEKGTTGRLFEESSLDDNTEFYNKYYGVIEDIKI